MPVPKRKKPGPYRLPPREQRHGLVIVNTGHGRGKTAAALGLLLRASGRGMHAAMFEFVKASGRGGEHRAARRLGAEIVPLGDGSTSEESLAHDAWTHCASMITTGEHDLLILDGITVPMTRGWVDTHEVIDTLATRPKGTHVVITGADAAPALIDAADLVTEVRAAKEPSEPIEGSLAVHTGDGKGKTTAALGHLVRANGGGLSVGMFQFIKSAETRYGEHVAAASLGVDIVSLGDGFTWLSDNIAEDRALAERGWSRVQHAIETAAFDMLILDELTYCLTFGWLDEATVLATLAARPPGVRIIVTGRDASPGLVAAADVVTEMHLVRHPYRDKGIGAQPGIEL